MGEKKKVSQITRRGFIKTSVAAGGALLASNLVPLAACSTNNGQGEEPGENGGTTNNPSGEAAAVYMLTEISPASLLRIYEALGRSASGKVAVKLSTGEPGGHNFLQPALISDLVRKVNGTIIECNTAYAGGRSNTEAHLKAAADHGFTAIADVDIMDSEGEISLPVKGGKRLTEDIVGSHYTNYDFTVVLSHFK